MIKLTIPGRPVPKARPRLGYTRKKAIIYTPESTRNYEEVVGIIGKMACKEPLTGPVAVEIRAFTSAKMDADNIAKSALDGLNGITFIDDDQVVDLRVLKLKVKREQEERVEIDIWAAGKK